MLLIQIQLYTYVQEISSVHIIKKMGKENVCNTTYHAKYQYSNIHLKKSIAQDIKTLFQDFEQIRFLVQVCVNNMKMWALYWRNKTSETILEFFRTAAFVKITHIDHS